MDKLIDDGWTTVPRNWLESYQRSSREQINQYRVALHASVGFDPAKVREIMLQVEGMTLKEAKQTLASLNA